jgi:hypothetical protein
VTPGYPSAVGRRIVLKAVHREEDADGLAVEPLQKMILEADHAGVEDQNAAGRSRWTPARGATP